MTIEYSGKNEYYTTRCAIISYDDANKNEEILNDRIVDYFEKMTTYKISCEQGCTLIEVDDKDDYKELVAEYKKAKKTFKNCMKFGF